MEGWSLYVLLVSLMITLSSTEAEICETKSYSALLDQEDYSYLSCPTPTDPPHFTVCCPGSQVDRLVPGLSALWVQSSLVGNVAPSAEFGTGRIST